MFPAGTAKAVRPLLELHVATGDDHYLRCAREIVTFPGRYQIDAPGRPCQVDSGMSTAGAMAAIEHWLWHQRTPAAGRSGG